MSSILQKFSKIGLTVAILYLLIAIGAYLYSSTCKVDFCWVSLFYTTLPWSVLLNAYLPISWFNAILVIAVLLNTVILYLLTQFSVFLFIKIGRILQRVQNRLVINNAHSS